MRTPLRQASLNRPLLSRDVRAINAPFGAECAPPPPPLLQSDFLPLPFSLSLSLLPSPLYTPQKHLMY